VVEISQSKNSIRRQTKKEITELSEKPLVFEKKERKNTSRVCPDFLAFKFQISPFPILILSPNFEPCSKKKFLIFSFWESEKLFKNQRIFFPFLSLRRDWAGFFYNDWTFIFSVLQIRPYFSIYLYWVSRFRRKILNSRNCMISYLAFSFIWNPSR